MHIMDMFRSVMKQGPQDPMNPQNPNLNQQQNNQQQVQQNNQQQSQQQNTPVNGDQTQNNNQQQNNANPQEPDYSKLWQTDPNQKGPADPAAFNFTMDQQKVNQTFGQLDFTKVVTPELIGKIKGGGEDAISATLTAMNTIAQEAVKTAVIASSKITETGIQTTGQRMKEYLPGAVRELTVSGAVRQDNPLMSDPAFAPLVDAATIQMSRQFPTATPDEVKQHVSKYFDTMAEKFVSRDGRQIIKQPENPQSRASADFSNW
jgi:hypothetical protein